MGEGVVIDFLVNLIGLVVIVAFLCALWRPAARWIDRHPHAQLRFAVFAFVVYLCDITVSVMAGHRPWLELAILLIVGGFIRSTATVIRRRRDIEGQHPSRQP